MADSKKYYYMRLTDSYFDSDEQVLLESMPDGYLYSNILLKLYLKSLKRDGLLMFNDRIPYNAQMIANITRHQVGTVEKALNIFQQLGIIEIMDSGAIYMLDVQNFVGKTSTEADRKRAYRARIATEKAGGEVLTGSCTYVQDGPDICPPKIKIETEKKLDVDVDVKSEKNTTTTARYGEFPVEKTQLIHPETPGAKGNGEIADGVNTDPYAGQSNDRLPFYTLEVYAANNLMHLSTSNMSELADFKNKLPEELIRHAVDEACANGKPSFSYVRSILLRYLEQGIKTLGDAKASEDQHRAKKQNAENARKYNWLT